MYTRSERLINFVKNDNPDIGPSTYQKIEEYDKTKCQIEERQRNAPFSSRQPRLSLFNEIQENPSPNEYNTSPIPINQIGRVVPFSRSNRFSNPKYSSPGPATYNVRQKIGYEVEKSGPKIGRLAMNSNMGYGYTPKIDYIPEPELFKDNKENNSALQKKIDSNENANNANVAVGIDEDSDDGNMVIKNYYNLNDNEQAKKKGNNDNIERCNLVWKRKFVTPSIPYKNLTYGFVENQDGEIVPRKPPENDNTIGPAYYNVTDNSVQSNNVYRGGFTFGNGIKEREVFKVIKGVPGPGKYNLTKNIESYGIKKKNKATALMKFAPNTRFSEAIVKQEIKKNIPGPGAYKVDVAPSNITSKKKDLFLFGGKGERFKGINTLCNNHIKDDCTPGPGAYDIEKEGYENDYLYKIKSKGKSVLSKEDRFKNNIENQFTPGPGQYNIKFDFDPRIYHNVPSTKTYGFGTTSERFPVSKFQSNPGPGQYNYTGNSFNKAANTKEKPITEESNRFINGVGATYKNPNGVTKFHRFKSKSNKINNNVEESTKVGFGVQHDRFANYGENNTPAPGMYDSSKAYNMLKSHGKLEVTLKNRYELIKNNNRLPPGLYDPSLPEKKNFHAPVHDDTYMGKAERFSYKDNKLPGPSDYLSPRYDGSLIKKSFNVTFKDKEILKWI